VAAREKLIDRGTELARRLLRALGLELKAARRDRGLSQADVGRAAGCSASTVSRVERGMAPAVSIMLMARLFAVVGLDLSARAFPGGQPLRDAAHVRLLARLRGRVHPSLGWATEVPLPLAGDQRAWDAMIGGPSWRFGVEAETAPTDVQALTRRLQLKRRDGQVSGLILLLPNSARTREFLAQASDSLHAIAPVPGVRALERLGAALEPEGNSIVVL
jgi:transcriptional regulator with XRE-family HTH domain